MLPAIVKILFLLPCMHSCPVTISPRAFAAGSFSFPNDIDIKIVYVNFCQENTLCSLDFCLSKKAQSQPSSLLDRKTGSGILSFLLKSFGPCTLMTMCLVIGLIKSSHVRLSMKLYKYIILCSTSGLNTEHTRS